MLAADPRTRNPRQLGTIAAFDIVQPESGYLSSLAPRLAAFYRERRALIRPLGTTVYVMPPYCTGAGELAHVWDALAASLDMVALLSLVIASPANAGGRNPERLTRTLACFASSAEERLGGQEWVSR